MTVDLGLALSFGSVASDYDRFRPGYPAQLVDEVLAYARLGDSARALEVGAGTGKATLAFATRGLSITAVEPDPEMAELLRHNASSFDVRVVVGPFETFEPADAFGLVYCGQAWHWVEPEVRWDRAARALAPGGTLALFWNRDRPADPAVLDILRAAHAEHAPQVWHEPASIFETADGWPEMSDHPQYTGFRVEVYPWRRTLPTADFLANMATLSRYITLEPVSRAALFGGLASRLGETVELEMHTELYMARTR